MKSIYLIKNDSLKKCYIGSTNQKYLSRRLHQHKYNFKKYKDVKNGLKPDNNFTYNYCSSYDLMDGNVKIELLEKVEDEERYNKEKHYINNYNIEGYSLVNKMYK